MSAAPSLSIVIAVQHSEANLPDIREALQMPLHPDVEFIFVHAALRESACGPGPGSTNVMDLFAGGDALIPVLWREGIRAAAGRWVATTTAQCIPARDWVARLQASVEDPAAAIGGVFVNDPRSRAADWAIFLLRYAAFAAPQAPHRVDHVAADNALYRRALVVAQKELLDDGFWEPSFHARFRAQGYTLRIDPTLCVTHRNRYRASEFFRQRVAHGRRFGRDRAVGLAWPKRLGLLVASPLLPALFMRKIVRAALTNEACASQLPRATGWLMVFLFGWGCGEGLGYLDAVRGKQPS